MKIDREHRRTAAQFLNGLAVAMVAALVFAPLAGGAFEVMPGVAGLAGSAALHAAAMLLARGR